MRKHVFRWVWNLFRGSPAPQTAEPAQTEVVAEVPTKAESQRPAPKFTNIQMAGLGCGHVAYVKQMTPAEAGQMYPRIAYPQPANGVKLYSLHAADGTPLALTESRQSAIGYAIDGQLDVAAVH